MSSQQSGRRSQGRPVRILSAGGTFGMEFPVQGNARSLDVPKLSSSALKARLLKQVPELGQLARCEIEVLFNLDSAHLEPDHWCVLASAVKRAHQRGEGVVILHGTDTAAYTASALSFLLRPCPLPVVITGAQRPLAATRNDARGNLLTAVELAASPRLHPSLQQVTLFFGEVLLQGNRARKRSAAEFDAFESPQASPLAVVGTEIRFLESKPEARKRSVRRSRARARSSLKQERFDQRIGMLHLTPGFPSKAVREALLPKLRALVLVAFASGTAPTQDPEFLALLQAARREGKPVIVTTEGASRVPSEAPEGLAAYAAGEKMLKEGVLWAGEMTPECAYVKAALGIAELPGKNPEADFQAFSRFWSMNFANEGSPSS